MERWKEKRKLEDEGEVGFDFNGAGQVFLVDQSSSPTRR